MRNNKALLHYILGGVTVILFIPIVESLSDLIAGYLETIKIKNNKKIIQGNNELRNIQLQSESTDTVIHGFQYTGDPNIEYEDED